MANIPTIPGTSEVQDQSIGVKVDPTLGLQLQGQVAKSFGSAINTIIDYEDRKQKAEEVYVQNTATLSFHKMAADFREKINSNQFADDRDIVPEWENNVKDWEAQNAPLFERLTPQAKVHMKGAFDLGVVDTTAEFKHAADQQQLKRTVKSHIATGKLLKESGDQNQLEAYKKQTEQMQADGMLSQEQADYELSTADRDFETANVFRTITGASQAARIKLRDDLANDKFKHLDPKVTQRAIVENNNAITVSQRNKLNALSTEADKNPLGVPDMTKAKDALDNEEITAVGYQSLLNRTKRVDAITDKNNADLIRGRLISTNLLKVPDMEKTVGELDAQIKSIQSLPLRNKLTEELQRKRDSALKGLISTEKPEIQQQLDIIIADGRRGRFVPMTQGKPATAGLFGFGGSVAQPPKYIEMGNYKDVEERIDNMSDDELKEYGGATREDLKEASELHQAKKLQDFLDIIHANPQKASDPDWLVQQRRKIEFPDAEVKAKESFDKKQSTSENVKLKLLLNIAVQEPTSDKGKRAIAILKREGLL